MAQCEATAKTPGRANFGHQCKRNAVHGSKMCERHGGVDDSTMVEKIRQRVDHPKVRCGGTRSNGEPCKNYAIKGATVCSKHGGQLPNVKQRARERMQELVNPALTELQRILTKTDTSDADRLRAIQMLLDRTGNGVKSEVTLDVKPWEQIVQLEGIYRQPPPAMLEMLAEVVEPEPAEGEARGPSDVAEAVFEREAGGSPPPRGHLRIVDSSRNPPRHQR